VIEDRRRRRDHRLLAEARERLEAHAAATRAHAGSDVELVWKAIVSEARVFGVSPRSSLDGQSRRKQLPMCDDLLRFELVRDGKTETLYVTGELDIATASALEHAVARSLDGQSGEFFLDVRDMTFMDSTGAQALLHLHRRLTALGRQLVVVSPTRPVHLVLEILGLDQLIDVRTTASIDR
jgi:anti-anti-sigma factor